MTFLNLVINISDFLMLLNSWVLKLASWSDLDAQLKVDAIGILQ